MLQEHVVKNYQKQVKEIKDSQDELEQYGRRLYIRIDGVPKAEKETSNNVFQMLNRLLKNPAVKYLTLQSMTGPIELVKDTLIKRLGWNVKAFLFGLQPSGIKLCFTTIGRI